VEGSIYRFGIYYRFFLGYNVLWDTLQEAKKEVTRQGSRKTRLTVGYAKRYFTLSVITGELSYSLSIHSPILRGTIPLALAALNIDYGRREFILDSGSDVWHLKASNEAEFDIWKTRLEDVWLKAVAGRKKALQDQEDGHEISTEWKQVEGLVDRLAMMKDFVNGMVQDIAHEGSKSTHSLNSLSLKKSVDNLRDMKTKDAKGMKIFRKKDKPTPPASPHRELSINSLLHGMTF
jgi:Pleckstrin homology domain